MARREPGVSVLSLYFPVSTDQGPPASSSSEETGGPLVCRVREGRIPGVQLLPRQLPTHLILSPPTRPQFHTYLLLPVSESPEGPALFIRLGLSFSVGGLGLGSVEYVKLVASCSPAF